MTDIWGNPEPRHIVVPVYHAAPTPARPVPYPGLCLLVIVSAVVAFLYVVGLISAFPRSGWHDAIFAAAFGLSFAVGTRWEAVRRIPLIGPAVYALPTYALLAAPFVLDAYLMLRR